MTDPAHSFTALDDAGLDGRIRSDLDQIAAAVRDHLGPSYRALVLGGGYGRGEGGSVVADDRLEPYNDYDLFVVVEGVRRLDLAAMRADLRALGGKLEESIGLEVELAPLRVEDLPRLPFTMMWCELIHGHTVVDGDPSIMGTAASMPPDEMPLFEGLHYLSNRSALLLWAMVEDLPPGRVWKFIHKAWLAVGAALLIAEGRFEVGYGRRMDALAALDMEAGERLELLRRRYQEASAARLRPTDPPSPAEIEQRLCEARYAALSWWGWFEARRTGLPVTDWMRYAVRDGLAPEAATAAPMMVLRHVRLMGLAGLKPLVVAAEHPRMRTIRALPALLDGQEGPALAALVGGGADHRAMALRCLELWRRS
jgi:hypothetical protein